MDDLISRHAAIDALGDAHFKNYGNAIMVIQALPSAEPERKTGKWVPFSPKSHLYSCSLCGQWADRHWNYCPNCGADMRGEE